MKYKMEELVPLVARLAKEYTAGESSSITYEKAQQFMEAVLYCIREGEEEESFSLIGKEECTPENAYEIGVKCVEEKTRKALAMYNDIMNSFRSYGNQCLYDTVAKGLPEFFKWYDVKYEPQNTILTLDYPVLANNPEHTGIDRIYDYLLCIQLEQKFLQKFPFEHVIRVLFEYHATYEEEIDNLCEIVLRNLLIHILPGKDIKSVRNTIIQEYCGNDGRMTEYLSYAMDNILVRLKVAEDKEKR